MKKQTLPIIILVTLVLSIISSFNVCSVSAQYGNVLIFSNWDTAHTANGFNFFSNYPNGASPNWDAGMAYFVPSQDGYLDRIIVDITKVGTPSWSQYLTVILYEVPVNTLCDPTGLDALTPNHVIYKSDIAVTFPTWQNYTITFGAGGHPLLETTKAYGLLFLSAKDGTTSQYLALNGFTPGAYSSMHSSNLGWSDQNNQISMIVYGTATDPEPTPTPSPTPSPTPEAMPNWISDIIDAIIPIFTPLLVIFICGALGWRFAGAWGFFGGINLAVVLMYVVAPQYMPLWAIVAIVVVDIGLLFGKVGFDRR